MTIFFVFKGKPNLIGGLLYHVTSLSIRSTVVYGLSVQYSDHGLNTKRSLAKHTFSIPIPCISGIQIPTVKLPTLNFWFRELQIFVYEVWLLFVRQQIILGYFYNDLCAKSTPVIYWRNIKQAHHRLLQRRTYFVLPRNPSSAGFMNILILTTIQAQSWSKQVPKRINLSLKL